MKKISPVMRTSVLVAVLTVSMQTQTLWSNEATAKAEKDQRGAVATVRINEEEPGRLLLSSSLTALGRCSRADLVTRRGQDRRRTKHHEGREVPILS